MHLLLHASKIKRGSDFATSKAATRRLHLLGQDARGGDFSPFSGGRKQRHLFQPLFEARLLPLFARIPA